MMIQMSIPIVFWVLNLKIILKSIYFQWFRLRSIFRFIHSDVDYSALQSCFFSSRFHQTNSKWPNFTYHINLFMAKVVQYEKKTWQSQITKYPNFNWNCFLSNILGTQNFYLLLPLSGLHTSCAISINAKTAFKIQ